jgi:hypothetical protein
MWCEVDWRWSANERYLTPQRPVESRVKDHDLGAFPMTYRMRVKLFRSMRKIKTRPELSPTMTILPSADTSTDVIS